MSDKKLNVPDINKHHKYPGDIKKCANFLASLSADASPACQSGVQWCRGFGCIECALHTKDKITENVDHIIDTWIKQGGRL